MAHPVVSWKMCRGSACIKIYTHIYCLYWEWSSHPYIIGNQTYPTIKNHQLNCVYDPLTLSTNGTHQRGDCRSSSMLLVQQDSAGFTSKIIRNRILDWDNPIFGHTWILRSHSLKRNAKEFKPFV